MQILGFHCLSPKTDSKSSAVGSTRISTAGLSPHPGWRQAGYWDGCSKASKHWPGEGNKTCLTSVKEVWESGDMTRAGRPVASLEKWSRATSGLKHALSIWEWRWEALQGEWGQLLPTGHCQQIGFRNMKKRV